MSSIIKFVNSSPNFTNEYECSSVRISVAGKMLEILPNHCDFAGTVDNGKVELIVSGNDAKLIYIQVLDGVVNFSENCCVLINFSDSDN